MAPGNGAFVGKSEKDGWTTWNWHARSVHTYGPVLNVGPYKVFEGDYASRFGNKIPMRLYYLPGEEEKAAELFREFPQTLDFWESRIGPYPWADQKMGVIRVPYSGLENQTLVGHSNDFPKTPQGFDWLMNHEFAHEWFGNQMSVSNYDDLWLHEGFGSYAQPLLGEYLGGAIDYMSLLKAQRAIIRNEQPLVTGEERSEKAVYADKTGPRGDIYPKGSWIAHTLAPTDRRRGVLQIDSHPGVRPPRSAARKFPASVRHDAGLSQRSSTTSRARTTSGSSTRTSIAPRCQGLSPRATETC